jgi:hypothetical protein
MSIPRHRRRLAVLTVILALLGAILSASSAAAAPVPAKAGGVYWGAWIGDQLTGEEAPWDMSAVGRMEKLLGKGLSLVQFSSPFDNCEGKHCEPVAFPDVGMDSIRDYGAIPVLSWGSQPNSDSLSNPQYQLRKIAGGAFDPQIRQFAEAAKAWGHPFFMRFNWEMNGRWFLWGTVNGNKPKDYIAAWRHVHDIFAQAGATNATWTWCPYADAPGRFTPMQRFYPGAKYVDWTCLDAYNWGKTPANPAPWRSFDQLFHQSYEELLALAPGKPVMLGEIASSGASARKATWISQMFKLLPKRYPLVRALIWFDQNDRGASWPLESSKSGLRAFKSGLKAKRYRGNGYFDFAQAPVPAPR